MSKYLTSNKLKLIALISMTVDHFFWIFYPGFSEQWFVILGHTFGRIAAPLFFFLASEAFYNSHNRKKYLTRLLIFSLVSHLAYCYGFNKSFISSTSVIFSIFLGISSLMIFYNSKLKQFQKYIILVFMAFISMFSDWPFKGFFLILNFGINRNNFKKQMLIFFITIITYSAFFYEKINKIYGLIQLSALLSVPLIKNYCIKRERGKKLKYFFYFYYPFHLIFIRLIHDYFFN